MAEKGDVVNLVLTKTSLDVDPDTVTSADTGYIAMMKDHMLGIREISIDLVHGRWSSTYTIQNGKVSYQGCGYATSSPHTTGGPIKDAMRIGYYFVYTSSHMTSKNGKVSH